MPRAIKPDVFDNQPSEEPQELRVPQARLLAALMPDDPTRPLICWRVVNRARLGVKAGYTAISGTVTRALNGVKPGSSSGEAHLGLLGLKMIEEVIIDIEGTKEVNYRITWAGIRAYQDYIKRHGELPPLKDRGTCINDRYKKGETDGD